MKRLFNLMALAIFAATLVSGCQKYDDTQIRQEIKDLGERIAALEAWTRNSQEAIDYVAVLKEAVKNMNSIESVNTFEDGTGSGYVITFTNKQTIKLYNGQDGDTFFGNVNVGSSCVEFILADGTSFFVDRVTNSIGFDSFVTKTIERGDTIWTVMNEKFTKSEFAAFTAEIKSNDGTAISVVTKSASEAGEWKIESIAPEFNEDGSLARPAGVVIADAPEAGAKGVLKVALVTNNGKETSSSLVIEIALDYLSFRAVEAGATVSMEIVGQCEAPSLEYSTDLAEWTKFDFGNPVTITLNNVGDKVYWRNTGKSDTFSPASDGNYIHFNLGSKKIAAQGNVMSLIDSSCTSKTIPSANCFMLLFYRNASLTTAPELPAEILAPNCYNQMFNGCSSLAKAPALPATQLDSSCYYGLFVYCTSLEQAPELPAMNLAESCYSGMFTSCTSLKQAPVLPAAELTDECYHGMFKGCTSLVQAPRLDAMNLATGCYSWMFNGCTALEQAPELPATDLVQACYYSMFQECTSLKKAPELKSTNLARQCYLQMFCLCSSLEEAPELPATELAFACYANMFLECTALKKAPELPAKKMEEACYYEMFAGCTSLKEAPELLPAMELADYCYDMMFQLCSSLEKAPELPATELAYACYADMFGWCESLKEAPELPATELEEACYYEMFTDCYSLKEAPELPAKKLVQDCYNCMFNRCFSLEKAPELPAMELAPYCYQYMFSECYELETAPELPATTLVEGCYEGIFDCCSNLNHIKVAFDDWNDGIATAGWVAGVGTEGTFECPEGLAVQYGDSFIPNGWSVNGAAPTATKSYAASSIKSISNYSKLLAPKTPKIQIRPVEREKIML